MSTHAQKTNYSANGYLESNYSHSSWRQLSVSFLLLKNPSSFPSFACPVFDWRMSAELYNEALILYLLLDPRFKYVYASATHKFLALVLDLNPTYHIYSVSPCLVSQQRQDPSAYEPLERHPSYLWSLSYRRRWRVASLYLHHQEQPWQRYRDHCLR